MPPFTRRTFVSAGATAAMLGTNSALLAKQMRAPLPAEAPNPEGVFSLYQNDGRALIVLRSAGRTPIPVVFDTGTNGLALDERVAKALQLQRVPNHVNRIMDGATGQSFDAFQYILPEISIGNIKIGDREVAAYPYNPPDEAGIFGPNLFAGQLVYLDLGASRIRVINKPNFVLPDNSATPYLGDKGNGLPSIEIRLPGKENNLAGDIVMAKLDSGNNRPLNLPESYIERLPLMRPPTIIGQVTSVTGSRPIMGGQLKGEVKIGTVTLTDPDVTFSGLKPNVGLPVIRQLRILLDPAAEQGWLLTPSTISQEQLKEYVGQYGIRRISLTNGKLVYQREGGPELSLTAWGSDLFDISVGRDQVQFERINGQIKTLKLITANNQMLSFDKT